jgi:mRNA-degrading endonuclease RelE of RelBE toxin-antitoxin system
MAKWGLVYSVADEVVIVTVIAVGKHDRNEIGSIWIPRSFAKLRA